MIVSHKYKFIYLRTAKTASSSLTEALGALLDESDYVASLKRPPWAKYSPIHHGALKRNLPQVFGLHPHATAAQAKSVLGAKIFNSYFKVAAERNPWDRQVSLYFQRAGKRARSKEPDFDRDMRSFLYRSTEYVRLNNWQIYAIGDDVVADQVMAYENLEDELESFRKAVGIPEMIRMPQLRSGHRPQKDDYRRHYSDVTRDMIARWYRREIKEFHYEF